MLLDANTDWRLRAVGGAVPDELADVSVPARIPGCVHLDLLAAGLIPDPYLDENEAQLQWIGRVDWRYETTFEWSATDTTGSVDLVADGLDTVATIELNGAVIARTANMHRSYRVPVAEFLRAGRNEVAITFAAGLDAAERASEELGPRPHVNEHPFNAIRKMAANYGWDWGPQLVTAGIWRSLRLHSWSVARLGAVRPLVAVDGETGRLHVHVDISRGADSTDVPVTVRASVGGSSADVVVLAGASSAVVELRVDDVQLWWPHGYGAQHRYPVDVALSAGGTVLDSWGGQVGFRTVELDIAPDEHGTRFALRVNGVTLFVRGVNWIPEDCFPSRIDRARYARRLTQARDANANLVRVWGGGIYESEDFYDVCDELGLLVWQDFALACAAYAEEEPLRSEIVAEAREAVTRLSPHPSLAIWNGGNENIWGYADWGWRDALRGRTWGWGYYTDLLPAIVAELDPTRPYTPGSPYSPDPAAHPNDPAQGTTHQWEVWNELDYTAYRDSVPRFLSEFGFQGPPTWATLTRAVHDVPLVPDSPGMIAHQKAEDGQGKLARGLKGHLPTPHDMADWHWATSLNQARAVAFGIEHLRSWSPICAGSIVWQLNDCWPVTSWSAVDGDGRRKPLWYALRRSYRDRLLTVQPRGGSLALIAVNDSGLHWATTVRMTRRDFAGAVLAHAEFGLDVGPRGTTTTTVPAELAAASDPSRELLLVEVDHDRAWWLFAEDVDAAIPVADFATEVEPAPGGYRLTVSARTLLRDLTVLADRVAPDAEVDDALITLLPGETVSFEIRTSAEVDPQRFADPLVLRTANQLVHPVDGERAGTLRPGG